MSLTYSLNQPNQGLPRVTAITLIALLHITVLVVFNNGIGSFFKYNPPHDITVVPVKPEPKPENPVSVPEIPPATLAQTIEQPIIDPGTIVFTVAPDHHDIDERPPVIPGSTDIKVSDTVIPPPVKVAVLNHIDPTYPARAEAAGEQGTVLLDVQIDARGDVVVVSIAQSSGFAELDTAAAKAVKHWHFTPLASGARVRVPIKFQLNSQKY